MPDHTTHDTSQEIPYGYCHCGCGQPAPIATQNHRRLGWIKGQPKRFISGHNVLQPLAPRFWRKVAIAGANDCWLWLGYRDSLGYGRMSYNGSPIATHRASWVIHYGSIPDGLWVLHRCDNPTCVNPAHLFLGTPADNSQDMVSKGRQDRSPSFRGEQAHTSKLTASQVLEIRRRCADGVPKRQIAREYGLDPSSVRAIVQRKNWKHI